MIKTVTSKKEMNFDAVSHLVPATYHSFLWNLSDSLLQNLNRTYTALVLEGYQITEIVPMYLEEFISMGANDLLVNNLSGAHTGTVDILHISAVYGYSQPDSNGVSLETNYLGYVPTDIEYSPGFRRSYLNEQDRVGFSVIKFSDSPHHSIVKIADERLPQYKDEFIFRVKGKDLKKIKVDNPSLDYFKEVLDSKEFKTLKQNFKKVQSNGEILGED